MRVILVSGGIDSTCAVYHYKKIDKENFYKNNKLVFIDYGQSYKEKELKAVKELFEKFDILKVGEFFSDDSFVPNRNLTLASIVASKYNPDEIVMGGVKDDMVEDSNPTAYKEMSDIISKFSRKEIKIVSPFWDKTKGEIVADFINENDKNILYSCVSCYSDGPEHCNDCPACFRRYVSFVTNGLKADISEKMIKIYLEKIHTYDAERQARTFRAVEKKKDILAYDIDGVLTIETDGHDYSKRTLNEEISNEIEKRYKDNYIVLYTSRFESDRNVTEKWLKDNKVKYHSLIMNKLPYKSLLDDKAFNYKRETK